MLLYAGIIRSFISSHLLGSVVIFEILLKAKNTTVNGVLKNPEKLGGSLSR